MKVTGYRNSTYHPSTGNYSFLLSEPSPFLDVSQGQYYYEAVLWAVRNGITSGTDAQHFSPNQVCTRGQVVSFLWRAMGRPEPQSTKCPFKDVKTGSYYYKAVMWAYEKGITSGTDKTHFSPEATVTRGQFVSFLWRAKGKPSTSGRCPFVDVGSNQYYYDAVRWAANNHIASGTDATHFSPGQGCTRGQVVSFLYRAEKN